MAYEVIMPYHLHMPSYFLETFTEYPKVNVIRFFISFRVAELNDSISNRLNMPPDTPGANYFFNHLSSQLKNVRCHNTPFWGFNTQWFSSG